MRISEGYEKLNDELECIEKTYWIERAGFGDDMDYIIMNNIDGIDGTNFEQCKEFYFEYMKQFPDFPEYFFALNLKDGDKDINVIDGDGRPRRISFEF